MARIIKFKQGKKAGNKPPWRGVRRRSQYGLFRSMWRVELLVTALLIGMLCIGKYVAGSGGGERGYAGQTSITCFGPDAIDGDTFNCAGRRIRLAGTDAPEMPGHCRPGRSCVQGDPIASRDHLQSLLSGTVTCRSIATDSYGRLIARCEVSGKDLSCEMLRSGHAARRGGSLSCPG